MAETLPDRTGHRHLAAKSTTIRPMQLLRHGASLLLVTALLAACGAPAPSAAPSAPTASQVPATSTEPSPTETAAPTPAGSPTPQPIADDPPPVALEVVADGLADPIGIASAPGGWLLVNERAGRVVAIHGGERSIALDITDRVLGEDERGLLGLVLHPELAGGPTGLRALQRPQRRHGAVGADGHPGRGCRTRARPRQRACPPHRGSALREPQWRPARLRAGRLPVVRARRRRLRGRPARQRPESVRAARLDPAPGRLRARRLHRADGQPVRRRNGRRARGLPLWTPEPMALQLRSRHGPAVGRRCRPDRLRGDRPYRPGRQRPVPISVGT